MSSEPIDDPGSTVSETTRGWIDGIDVFEHHVIDFEHVAGQGVEVAVVRVGRRTRQDACWIEHVSTARRSGLAVACYLHLYPSRTDVAVFLRRCDEQVGVFATSECWRRHVGFDDPVRLRWRDSEFGPGTSDPAPCAALSGARVVRSDRGGPGRHRVRPVGQTDREPEAPRLVQRGPTESVDHRRLRWVRTPENTVLQTQLNDVGARLVVDGVFGPQTDAAIRVCNRLCRRDRLGWPFGTAPSRQRLLGNCSVSRRRQRSRGPSPAVPPTPAG